MLEPVVDCRGDLPGIEYRRHRRRSVVAPRPGHGHARPATRCARDHRTRAARRARRLLGAIEVGDGRPRLMVDAAVALRAGAAQSATAARRRIQEIAQARRRVAGPTCGADQTRRIVPRGAGVYNCCRGSCDGSPDRQFHAPFPDRHAGDGGPAFFAHADLRLRAQRRRAPSASSSTSRPT